MTRGQATTPSRRRFLQAAGGTLLAGGTAGALAGLVDSEGFPLASRAHAATLSVALAGTQKFGDLGPMDDMANGLARLARDFHVQTKKLEVLDPSTYVSTLTQLAQTGVSVIVATFNEMTQPIAEVAPKFPHTKFVAIYSDPLKPTLPNVRTVAYDFYKGTYLSGILAGLATGTKHLGYVAGASIPSIIIDVNAFIDAARTVNSKIKFSPAYAGTFQDPNKGLSIALTQYGSGVDIIQTDAAQTTLGVVKAATQTHNYMIGDTVNNHALAPANYISSVQLLFGQSLYNQVKLAITGAWTGGHLVSGLQDNIVILASPTPFLQAGPASKRAAVMAGYKRAMTVRDMIVSGKIKVPYNTHA